jgi:hypothetical protein
VLTLNFIIFIPAALAALEYSNSMTTPSAIDDSTTRNNTSGLIQVTTNLMEPQQSVAPITDLSEISSHDLIDADRMSQSNNYVNGENANNKTNNTIDANAITDESVHVTATAPPAIVAAAGSLRGFVTAKDIVEQLAPTLNNER